MNRPLFPDIVVNGERIAVADIATEAQHHNAPKGKPGLAWRAAARALVIRALLLQEAARRGLRAEPADLGGGRYETGEEALIRALLDAEITVAPPPEETLRELWEKDPDRFRSPPLWEASHILVAAGAGDDGSGRARAEALARAVEAEPGAFARIAARESDCGSKGDGGALGQLGPGDTVPEFEAALRRLSPGAITPDPVRSRYGYHIIRLDARAEGRVPPYAAARPMLAEAVEKAAWARAARTFTDGLIGAADIVGIDFGKP